MSRASCLTVAKVAPAVMLVAVLLAACSSPSPVPDTGAAKSAETVAVETPTNPPATETAPPTATLQPSSTSEEKGEGAATTEAATAVPEIALATSTKPARTATTAPATPTKPAVTATTAPPTPTKPAATASSIPATPTQTPEPSRAPTETPTVKPEPTLTAPPGPQVLAFRVSPEVTQNLGDRLTIEWQAVGERAELCPISGRGPLELRCEGVALVGSRQHVTDEESMTYTGFGLRVTTGNNSVWGTAQVNLQCQNLRPWFFEGAPQRCPEDEALTSFAAGQHFERGMMVWAEETDDFYVFYEGEDERGFQTFDWVLDPRGSMKPGASPDNRVGESPPEGLYEPISGFGMVWRGEIVGIREDVRERLGWATEPEYGYDTAHQCITPSHPALWSCFLRGPGGEVLHLRPDSTAQVRFLWNEW